MKKINGLIASAMIFSASMANAADSTNHIQKEAIEISGRVAQKLIRDTRFDFKMVPQKEELGMQVIDFSNMVKNGQVAYAVRQAKVNADTTLHIAVSGAGRITIWLNKKQVFQSNTKQLIVPKETAYNRFLFSNGFDAKFEKGNNELIIRYEASTQRPVVFIRPQLSNGDLNTAVNFTATLPFTSWYLLGTFEKNDTALLTGKSIQPYYNYKGKKYTWEKPVQRLLPELLIDSTITYQRDAYAEWHYANGSTVWSVMNLANATGDQKYLDFVKRYTGFTIQHSNYFQKQYDSLFAFHGSFHRLFRLTMLDDAGAAVLPFIELYLKTKDSSLQQIITPVSDYIMNKQVRLPDGTFCRPEPTEFTIWADDLFMSAPFLLRMAKITGQEKYREEAVKQMLNFRKYLYDPQTGLYKHGWFSTTGQRSAVAWARANGWLAWATAEVLSSLPQSHPSYPTILKALQQQLETLVQYQAKSGMWHQVLNNAASYEETSCTAIFTGVLARAVREGWIDQKYKTNALSGWKALTTKIEKDGTVHGICRGTEIGVDEQYYFTRPRFDQDPRGLGAVITAGIEISKLK
jgi:unsaturated rhamnogalacturonyl hydrolase